MRIGELINLKISDIDSQLIMKRVKGAKGSNDRMTLLSASLLKKSKHLDVL